MLRAEDVNGREASSSPTPFCRQARLRVERLFDALWSNTDAADTRLARQTLKDRYSWLEEGILDPAPEGAWIAATAPGTADAPSLARKVTAEG